MIQRARTGQAFLSIIFFIGGVVVVMGITMAIVAGTFIDSGYGAQAADNAEAVASAGAEDATLNLVRNNTFQSAGYMATVGSSTATVTVAQNSPSAGLATVLSSAIVSGRSRKIQVVLSVNAVTGQVSLVSWADVQ